MFNISKETLERIVTTRRVELNMFAIMPNHFHLLVQEKKERGISWYLQRIQNCYAKYFNAKYKKRGHLFQGYFRAVPVATDEQLLYLSAYIHRNPRDLQSWRNREFEYPWSSYQDCVGQNRWGQLLVPSIVLDQFSSGASYREFVDTSTAKLKSGKLPVEILLD
jgi:putative transposase